MRQMDVPVGRAVYTPLLTPGGGFRSDLTILRLGDERFRVVTGGLHGMADLKWFRDHADGAVVTDLTSAWTTLGLWGPRARDILSSLTGDDVSHEGFPFARCRIIEVGPLQVLALRISYVGDLGWELHVPIEQGARLWDMVWEAGEPHGIIPAGIGVYGTTGRIEKGYRAFGFELDAEYDVVEADMAWGKVKDQDFIGREAHLRHRSEDPAALMCTLTVDDHTSSSGVRRYMLGREPIVTRDGEPLVDAKGRRSFVTTAGSAPSVGKYLLMAYLPPEHAVEGQELAVEYMNERYPVTVAVAGSTPIFDPENSPHPLVMDVLVCVKRVPLTGGKMVLTADERAIETRHLGFTVSPHEECGVEEAVRLVEAHGGSVTVVTLGPPEAEEQLRDALAIGADRAILLETDGSDWDPESTAAALAEVIAAEAPDLVIFGNESADAGGYQVGIRVAHALGRPCVTGLKALAVEDGELRGEQESGSARDVYRVPLPAVVTVKEGINLPRYPSVPAKLRARTQAGRAPRAGAARRAARARAARRPGGPRAAGRGARRGSGRRPRRRRAVPAAGGRVTVLVFVEHAGGRAGRAVVAGAGVRAGVRRANEVDAVLVGGADAASNLPVGTAHVAELDGGYAPQAWARAIAELEPTVVVAAGSDRGNEVLAHAAVMTGGALAANCVARDARRPRRGHPHALGRQPARGGAAARRR